MTGDTALIFSRIRKLAPTSTSTDEGTDFARAQRQQKVLEAARDTALQTSTLLNPVTMTQILQDLGSHVQVDMEIWEMVQFAHLIKDVDRADIINRVVDYDSGLVVDYTDPETRAALIVPSGDNEDYSRISAYAEAIFDTSDTMAPTVNTPAQEAAHVVIQNASNIDGLGSTLADRLTAAGVTVTSTDNALSSTVTTSHIYQLGDDDTAATRALLEQLLKSTSQTATIPDPSSVVRLSNNLPSDIVDLSTISTTTDIVIVLGSDAAESLQ
jgi:hypothetical protein